MSYLYKFESGTPEGTEISLELNHDQLFSEREFASLCEQCILNAAVKQYPDDKEMQSCQASSPYFDAILREFEKLGFIPVFAEYDASYYFEPYFNRDNIKNQQLLDIIDYRPTDEEEEEKLRKLKEDLNEHTSQHTE